MLSLPGRNSSANQELVFLASNLQPLGLTTFLVHMEEEQVEKEDSREEEEDGSSGWLMGKEGGLTMMEASPSSSKIRLIDPCRGVDIEVISS